MKTTPAPGRTVAGIATEEQQRTNNQKQTSLCVRQTEVQLGAAVLPLGRPWHSMEGYVRLVGEQCAAEPQLQSFSVPDYTRAGRQHLLAPRHDLSTTVELHPPSETRLGVSTLLLQRAWREDNLPLYAQHVTQPFQNSFFWSALILDSGVTRGPDAESS